jgi:hypothetical protein
VSLRVATVSCSHEEVGLLEFCGMLTEGLVPVKLRDRAELGDKTVVDALNPAVLSLQQSVRAGCKRSSEARGKD